MGFGSGSGMLVMDVHAIVSDLLCAGKNLFTQDPWHQTIGENKGNQHLRQIVATVSSQKPKHHSYVMLCVHRFPSQMGSTLPFSGNLPE